MTAERVEREAALGEESVWPHCAVHVVAAEGEGYVVQPGPTTHVSAEGVPWQASPNVDHKGTVADLDNARRWFPERSTEDWVELFDRAPHVMYAILGDIYRETKALAEREAGQAKIGRRPKAVNGNLDELWDMITPQYALEPFPEACRALVETAPSLRAFAARVPMNHHTLTRMMRGQVHLDRYRLEQIARAGKVSPAYFREYREQIILEGLSRLLDSQPNLSVSFHRQITQALAEVRQ